MKTREKYKKLRRIFKLTEEAKIGNEIGHVIRKTKTREFTFEVLEENVSRNQFVLGRDKDDGRDIISQIKKIEKHREKEFATCRALRVINNGKLKPVKRPLSVDSPVYIPATELLAELLSQVPGSKRLHMGSLMDRSQVPVYYNYEDFSTHLFVVASTGGGKSYTLGVLMEELLEHKKENEAAVLVFDFHNEFGGLALSNKEKDQVTELRERGLSPKEYSDDLLVFNWKWNPIKLKPEFTPERLKFLSNMPEEYGLFLQSLLEETEEGLNLKELQERVEKSDLHHARKRAIKSRIEGLEQSGLFADQFFEAKDIIEPGKVTLVQLGGSGLSDWAVRFVVADLLRDLYQSKLQDEITSDVILFLDEAHKFSPRSGGDPLGKIIHSITREGRKLGLWLVLSTQTSRDLSESVMKNCNSLLALRSPKRQTKVLSRIYGISKEKTDILGDLSPGKGYLQAPSLPFSLMINVRPRKTSEMPKKGRRKKRIQNKIKEIALSTKERLLYLRPKEKIKELVTNHKKYKTQKITKQIPLARGEVETLVSEMKNTIIFPPSGEYCYSRPYWEELQDKISQLLEKEGRVNLQEITQELDIPLEDVKKLVSTLDAINILDNIWYSTEQAEKIKQSIREMVQKEEKIAFSVLSNAFNIPKNEFRVFFNELQGDYISLSSNMIYDPSLISRSRQKIRDVAKEELFIPHKKLKELVDLPPKDIKHIIEDLPLIHIRDEAYWYWRPKLKKLQEKIHTFKNEKSEFTIDEIQREFPIPKTDIRKFVKDLGIQESLIQQEEREPTTRTQKLTKKIIPLIKEMSPSKRYVIKLLLRNKGEVPAAKVFDLVDERVVLSLQGKHNIIKRKTTNGNEIILLALQSFIRKQFEITLDQASVDKVEKALYNRLVS